MVSSLIHLTLRSTRLSCLFRPRPLLLPSHGRSTNYVLLGEEPVSSHTQRLSSSWRRRRRTEMCPLIFSLLLLTFFVVTSLSKWGKDIFLYTYFLRCQNKRTTNRTILHTEWRYPLTFCATKEVHVPCRRRRISAACHQWTRTTTLKTPSLLCSYLLTSL